MRVAGGFAAATATAIGPLPRVPAMDTELHHPLRDGNRLQRAYYRWAAPRYARMDPEQRARTEQRDILRLRGDGLRGLQGLALGWLCGLVGVVAGLGAAGMPWGFATGIGGLVWLAVGLMLLAAWFDPEPVLAKRSGALVRRLMLVLAVAPLSLLGFVAGHWRQHGELNVALLMERLQGLVPLYASTLLATLLGLALLAWAVAWTSQQTLQRQLETLRLTAERDAAAHAASEARLRLLRGQIQPHFIFNTLATLQHWVDKRDERAGPLLRELTAFLRESTDVLDQARVSVAEEARTVQHYLAILQARLGDRLVVSVSIDPELAQHALPPGLLLTLVENAFKHGIEPKIGGGRVSVRVARANLGWQVCVEDDGVGVADGASAGVGLENLRERLQHHFAGKARFSLQPRAEGGTRACIEVEAP